MYPSADGVFGSHLYYQPSQGSELVVTRTVSKTVNPGSNPGSPALDMPDLGCDIAPRA